MQCPNLIGFKDGHGNVEQLTCLRETLGDRLIYVGGMPTAEVFAAANRAIGVSTYSSAIFNFLPEYAQRFFAARPFGRPRVHARGGGSFFIPYLALRNQRRGYAVSIVKAGLSVVGRPAGPVRPPLLDLTADQEAVLAGLVARAMTAMAPSAADPRSGRKRRRKAPREAEAGIASRLGRLGAESPTGVGSVERSASQRQQGRKRWSTSPGGRSCSPARGGLAASAGRRRARGADLERPRAGTRRIRSAFCAGSNSFRPSSTVSSPTPRNSPSRPASKCASKRKAGTTSDRNRRSPRMSALAPTSSWARSTTRSNSPKSCST